MQKIKHNTVNSIKTSFLSIVLLCLISACTKKDQSTPAATPQINALTVALGSTANLGEIIKGQSKIFTLKIENPETSNFTGPATISGNYFSVLNNYNCPVLNANSSCSVKIKLDSKLISGGILNEVLTIGQRIVFLSINVIIPAIETPNLEILSEVHFGMLPTSNIPIKTILVKNLGTQTITGQQASINFGNGSIAYDSCSGKEIKPKSSCLFKVVVDGRYIPNDPIFGHLNFAGHSVILTANIIPPLTFDESLIDLGPTSPINVFIGSVNPPNNLYKTLTFVNDQPSTQSFTASFTPGNGIYLLANNCQNVSLAPQGTCFVKLAMPSSTGIGTKTATLNMGSYVVNLTGTVVANSNLSYEARSFTAYSPIPQVCDGIVHQTRNILSCFRIDNNEQVLNSFCTDPNQSIDTPSPAGAIADLTIVGGVQHRGCNLGESTVQITGVDCNVGFIRQGDLCIPYNLQVPSTKGFNGTISSIVTLSTGEIIYGGSFDSFTDNDTTIYNLRGVVKFSSTGQIDTSFINNAGTNVPLNAGGGALVVDSSDNIYGASAGGILWKTNSAGVINNDFKNNTNNKITSVKAIVLDNAGNLIVGGFFTSFGTQTNNARGIAKISTDGVFNQAFSDNLDVVHGVKANTSGISSVLAADVSVNTLAIDSSGNIYAGGSFFNYNGVANNANKILKLSSTGVFDQAFSDGLDATSGVKASTSGFYNTVNTPVYKIVVHGSDLYIGGAFSHYKGVSFRAMRVAKLSTTGVIDQTFSNNLDVVSGTKGTNSGFNNGVRSLAIDNGSLYLVGDFTQFKNIPNNAKRVARLSLNGVFDQTFSDSLDGIVGVKGNGSGFNAGALSLLISNGNIFVGGGFDSFKNTSAKFTAKFSTGGIHIPFVASSSLFNGIVYDIKQDLDGSTYFVGNFTYYNGKFSPYIVKLNSDFSVDDTFMQNIGTGFNNYLKTIAFDGLGNVFLGGFFTSFNDIANVNRVVKLSSTGILNSNFMNNLDLTPGTKAATSGFNSNVNIIKVGSDGNLYIGGNFQRVKNNIAAKWLARLSMDGVLSTDFLTGYGSGLNNNINGLGLDNDNNVYVTGIFTSFGGIANNANGLAKFSAGGVFDQTFSDSLDVSFGTKTASSGFGVTPSLYQGQGILVTDNMLFVVGSFSQFKGSAFISRGITKFDLSGNFNQDFKNNMGPGFGAGGTLASIDTDGEYLYVAGGITGWNGVSYTARGIAKLSFDGFLNQDFMDHMNADYQDSNNPGTANNNTGFDSIVETISVGIHGELLIGGQFNSFKQLKYERAVILNADGSLPVQ